MVIIDRRSAYMARAKRFYTGLPCRRGHVAERYTSTGGCVVCLGGLRRSEMKPHDKLAVPLNIWRGVPNDMRAELVNYLLTKCVPVFFASKGRMSDGEPLPDPAVKSAP